uniref:Transposase n=1 Tax=Angiostrongylus cantonensis TaxID=6313 RepID=A0A0K0DPD4_ANGCA
MYGLSYKFRRELMLAAARVIPRRRISSSVSENWLLMVIFELSFHNVEVKVLKEPIVFLVSVTENVVFPIAD